MKKVGSRQSAVVGRLKAAYFCLLLSATCLPACSVPNLEPPECTASRVAVREFYSFHFGNDMRISLEGLKAREKFITPALLKGVQKAPEGTDPFTIGSNDLPKAFRAGECRVISPDRTEFDVLLFWKDDTRSEQRAVKVQAAKVDERWLVDRIVR